ncbi:MAG: DUF4382 domain-containing protein [Deltaproteobacteria bacterium]|nr:MAG: DUF4382 domain-containing protein [Deltaproteobacteria bacterium]
MIESCFTQQKGGSMKSSKFYLSAFLIISVIIIAAVFVACGGGGGGSSSGSAPASGSVAVMLTDGPLEDLQKLNIWITKVSLLRADNGQEVVVFEDDLPGHEVDILRYREYEYLLTVNQEVPVGTYSKVRLEVSKVEAVGGDCDAVANGIEIKLPSGKIDLNPRGTFQVVEGEALVIRLDIDAKKSFLLHQAGNSGKCIFRPVIFVDIKSVDKLDSCPEVLNGRIVSLEKELSGSVTGFALDLYRGDLLQVSIDSGTVIFDENGLPGDKSDIELRKSAYVRGRIQSDGSLLASLVVMGDVLKVKGTATEAVVVDQDQYTMTLDPYQELIGSVEVGLASKSIILIDCDTPVGRSYIQQGVRTTVIGKYDTEKSVLRAVAVIVEPRGITGRLTKIVDATGGSNLTITLADSPSTEIVFLPFGQNVYLQGDGVVALGRLQDLVECTNSNIQVRVLVDPAKTTTPPTTKKVYVIPDQMTSDVDSVGTYTIFLTDGYIIDVETDATIIKKTDGRYFHIELSDIQHGNEVTVFGLDNCRIPNHFYGYIVLVED